MSSVVKSIRGSKTEANTIYSDKTESSKLYRESDIIWPEWSDMEINSEKWGPPLKYDTGGKGRSTTTGKESKGKTTSRVDNSAGKFGDYEQFEDPYPVELPWSLHKGNPIYWQRPSVLFPEVKQVIRTDDSTVCPDLITSNRKILRSEFVRSFISSIQILTYIGYQLPFEIEWQSILFTANTRHLPWEPWHHIYSIGRAGGSTMHNPVCNFTGKYAVRLFWLGCWRKIFVDDRLPVTAAGRILLPTTTIENTNELELWPLLLTKALMKIASLSWTDQLELVDFDIITCLTGWAVQKLNIKGLDLADKWEICSSYSDHFTWDRKLLKDEDSAKSLTENNLKIKETKEAKKKSGQIVKVEKKIDFHLVGTFADLRNYPDILEDITPCWSHEFLLESTRNIPLVKQISDITDELAPWKEYRWIDWAIDHGLWEAEFTLENKQFIKIVTSLRKVLDNNTIDLETSYREKCIKNSVDAFTMFLELKETGKALKKSAAASTQTKEKPKKPPKPTKAPKSPKIPKMEKFVDPSIWCYFKKIGEHIHSLSIYIKPSSFSSRYVLTNFKLSGSPLKKSVKRDDKRSKDDRDDAFKHILWENILQKSRNDTMYLFTDSIDYRLTVFTLGHIGKDFPECQKDANAHSLVLPIECTKTVCVSNNCVEECKCQKKDSIESVDSNFIDRRRTASIIIEDYDWKSRQTGDMSMFLKTYGTSSLFFNFARGRHVKRIWMNAESAFCLHVFSDDPHIKIGKCDEILERMAMESELLTNKTFDISYAFGGLVQCFGTSDYPRALKIFYKSYLPGGVQLSKKNAARIHECFFNELKLILTDCYPDMIHYDISRAIRVLFLNPNFRIPYVPEFDPYIPPPQILPQINSECPCVDVTTTNVKQIENAAVKIQSVMKMYYIKRLKDIHSYNNNNTSRLIDCIKSIFMDIFSPRNRDMQCMKLMRAVLFNPNIRDLVPNYIFWKDLKTVIDLKIISGDVNEVKNILYVPLVKKCFYCVDDEIYMRPYIYSTLQSYILRIFDNDTDKEIERYTNNTLVNKYVRNKSGYTILAYGFSNLDAPPKNHSWKLLIVSEKIFIYSAIDIEQNLNSTVVLDGVYVPNLDNLICKIKVKVIENCRGSFHLHASSPSARMKMICSSSDGNILAEAYGMSTVMIPFISLNIETDSLIAPEVSIEKNFKQFKKMKSQRRASSKLFTMKDKRKMEKDSAISIQTSIIMKRKAHSFERKTSYEPKDFYIRVFVLENSWPLNIAEWNNVKTVRNQLNVEPEIFPAKPTVNKTISMMAQKRLLMRHTPRRGSKSKETGPNKPYWVFTSYSDGPAKQMAITIDTSRQEEIKEIKRQIFSEDPLRYLEGKDKRKEFLDRSYIQWTPVSSLSTVSNSDNSLLVYLENTVKDITFNQIEMPLDLSTEEKKIVCHTCQKDLDPVTFEYLKAPESVHTMLPPFDYNKYHEKMNENSSRTAIDSKRAKELYDEMYNLIDTFEEENETSREAVDKMLRDTKLNYAILNKWYKEIREQTHEMMTRNDNRRENYKDKRKEIKSVKDPKKKDGKTAKRK